MNHKIKFRASEIRGNAPAGNVNINVDKSKDRFQDKCQEKYNLLQLFVTLKRTPYRRTRNVRPNFKT